MIRSTYHMLYRLILELGMVRVSMRHTSQFQIWWRRGVLWLGIGGNVLHVEAGAPAGPLDDGRAQHPVPDASAAAGGRNVNLGICRHGMCEGRGCARVGDVRVYAMHSGRTLHESVAPHSEQRSVLDRLLGGSHPLGGGGGGGERDRVRRRPSGVALELASIGQMPEPRRTYMFKYI